MISGQISIAVTDLKRFPKSRLYSEPPNSGHRPIDPRAKYDHYSEVRLY